MSVVVERIKVKAITSCIPKNDLDGWEKGREYKCVVQRMSDSRIQIYKDSAHFREISGHRAYDTTEDLRIDFTLIDGERTITKTKKNEDRTKTTTE